MSDNFRGNAEEETGISQFFRHRWREGSVWVLTGETIADPFCGSGTTGVAALGTDRGFVGADLEPTHVETTRTRLMQ